MTIENNYNYPFSFSGTDVEAYIIQGNETYKLNSLSTISFQVNEMRNPVRRLGFAIPVGFTKAIRTIAGTLVLTVLKDHPLAFLKKATESEQNAVKTQCVNGDSERSGSLSILNNQSFDLLLIYQSEGHKSFYSEFKIKGISLISQSMVTSVNDMVTEMVFQFMAKDFDDFKLIERNAKKKKTTNELPKATESESLERLQERIDLLTSLIDQEGLTVEERQTLENQINRVKEEINKVKGQQNDN
jgi:hypothetical protein